MSYKKCLDFSNFKKLRNNLGFTQLEFARSVGFSQSFVSLVEHGVCSPSLKYLYCVATVHNVSADWLVGLDDDIKGHYINHKVTA